MLTISLFASAQTMPRPRGYSVLGRARATEVVPVIFGIQQRCSVAQLSRVVDAVSALDSPSYARYVTLDELNAECANPAATEAVVAWLSAAGFQSVAATRNGDYVRATAPIATVERALDATFHVFAHADIANGGTVVRTEEWTLPSDMRENVDFVGQINDFAGPLAPRTSRPFAHAASPDGTGNASIALVNSFYNVRSNTVKSAKATHGVCGIGQQFDPKDLIAYAKTFDLSAPTNVTVRGVAVFSFECLHQPNSCLEASLDLELIQSMASGVRTDFDSMDPNNQSYFLNFVTALANEPAPTLVNSISYTMEETKERVDWKAKFELEATKLAARGVTLVAASGDDGVGGYTARNTGTAGCGFNPAYPASSPYVLTVGATNGPEMAPATKEVACTFDSGCLITSGGGFSDFYPRPAYQNNSKLVDAFLAGAAADGTLPPTSMFGTGRAYPDIALLAHAYPTLVGGNWFPVSGTSASAPLVAGMLTLINGERISRGQPAVGFVNPALYALAANATVAAKVFHDIVDGKNNCCAAESDPVCCPHGFTARAGYDPVSGLGSVDFNALLAALLAVERGPVLLDLAAVMRG